MPIVTPEGVIQSKIWKVKMAMWSDSGAAAILTREYGAVEKMLDRIKMKLLSESIMPQLRM